MMSYPYIGAAIIGLVHGLEPGHGWPVAALYSIKSKSRYGIGLLSSLIIAFFHFISSIFVVAVFTLVNNKYNLVSIKYFNYLAVLLLFYMSYRAWNEKETFSESIGKRQSLFQLAQFAFILGFAHEEEFALLALCTDKINCLSLMITYATAVTLSIVAITLLAITAYNAVKHKIIQYDAYLPKIIAVVFFLFGVSYLFRMLR